MEYYINDSIISQEDWFSSTDFDGEIWKEIPGYNGAYAVSSYGRVCSFINMGNHSIDSKKRIKKHADNGRGYHIVSLSINNKNKMFYVHRLVGVSFLDNPNGFPTINHKDENKANNCVSNLEWCTYEYNNNYGTAKERALKTWKERGLLREIDVYDLSGNLIKHYDCAHHIEADGLSRRAVYNVCNGRSKTYKGLVYRFSGQPFSYKIDDIKQKGFPREIVKTDKDGNIICVYPSIKSAEKANGLGRNYLYSETRAWSRAAFINGYYFKLLTQL